MTATPSVPQRIGIPPGGIRLSTGDTALALITGDAQQVADAVAADLGIDEVFAEVLPEDKDSAVADLQHRGHTVAMVDVNDAPALVLAWAGIVLPMAVGAVLMSLSTIVVALNAQLLRRVDLRPEATPAA